MSEQELEDRFGKAVVDALRERIADGATIELDPRLFGASIGLEAGKAEIFLDAAAVASLVERREVLRCPNCNEQLDNAVAAADVCPFCSQAFVDHGGVTRRPMYRLSVRRTRDIPWLIAIHGFNTQGPWQQEFSWRVATKLKYSAPVFIYKYGLIRFSVLVRWRHRALARELGRTIRNAIAHARASGISEPPDIVIHSFGSQLFVQLLAMDEFQDLCFGRVIATGCVVRPDYNWSERIKQGRVESILNHCGGRDRAVPFAQFFIPGTGPGARHGFTDSAAINILSPQYGHSGCFDVATLKENLGAGGAWDRFLRHPPDAFIDTRRFQAKAWHPVWRIVRGLVRVTGIGLMAVAAVLLVSLAAILWLRGLSWAGLEYR